MDPYRWLDWLFQTKGFHAWAPTGWSEGLLAMHRCGDLMTVATLILVPAILAWGAAGTTEQDRSRVRVWWKLIFFFLASAAVELLTITILCGIPLYNLLGVAKLAAGVTGLCVLTPAVFQLVQRVRAYVPPEVHEATERRAESAERLVRSKTREAARLIAEVRALREQANPPAGSDHAEMQRTIEEFKRLVRHGV